MSRTPSGFRTSAPISQDKRVTNLDIAQKATLRKITEVASDLELGHDDYEPLGYYQAKLSMSKIRELTSSAKRGKLVLVTAVSPTPAGEGKTTVTIGLSQ